MNKSNPSTPYFDKIAKQWDRLRSEYFSDHIRDIAIQKAYLHPEMQVSDIGAGTGFMATGLAPLVKQVHIVDASSNMIDQAKKNLISFTNIEYHVSDGTDLPIQDASMDAVFANMYLHHCPDPLLAIHQMTRILSPGGRLVLTDLDLHANEWMKSEMADFWLGFERDQIRTWFEEAGLVNIFIDCSGENCKSDNDPEKNADIGVFIAVGTKKIEAHSNVQNNYSVIAQSENCGCSDSNCCSPGSFLLEDIGSVNWNSNYSLQEKSDLPEEVVEISLGCGNPIAMAGLKPGETVLDIGSGGGIDVFLAAKKVGPDGFVYGVDMTQAMLERARKAAKNGNYDNVEFKFGYAEQLPLNDEEVDVVISNCVINLSEDKGKVFKETYRVLKNHGRLEVNDTVFGGPVPAQLRSSSSGWAECVSGALPEQEYVDLVKQAGFKEIKVSRSSSSGSFYQVPFYSVQVSAKKIA